MGSYVCSIMGIIECARNINYKQLISNVKVYRLEPEIINDLSIFLWENIIKGFTINDDEYKCFMDTCLKKPRVMARTEKVYTHKKITQQLNGNDIKKKIYLHVEMKILAFIIDNKIKNRVFIAVSKRCCYLCELYIDFARKHGNHKKIYNGWKLPHVKDNDFKIGSPSRRPWAVSPTD